MSAPTIVKQMCNNTWVTHPNGQIVGYARVSTVDQNPQRQVEQLGKVDKLFTDYVSGSAAKGNRPQFIAMMDYLRDGDTLRVTSIDRLSRSLRDLQEVVDDLTTSGVRVEFIKENLTFSPTSENATDKLFFHLLGAFAEFERALIRERQREGIELAKKNGKYRGRAKIILNPEKQAELHRYLEMDVPKSEIARRLGISRSSLYRLLHNETND